MKSRRRDLVDILKEHSPLAGKLTDYEILELVHKMPLKRFREGATILKEGEPATSLMFLIEGEVHINYKDQNVARLQTGAIMGEAMFSEQGVRVADAIAVEPTEVLLLNLETYESLLREDSRVAIKCKDIFEKQYKENVIANERFFTTDTTKYLALIAHNEMKPTLVNFVQRHAKIIRSFPLVATGTTGKLLYKEAEIVLSKKVKSGPLGGDQAIGHMISTGNIRGIIFFRDPLSAHPHHADIEALGRLCDVYQIPLATNPSTGLAVLEYLSKNRDEENSETNPILDQYNAQQDRITGQ